MCHPSLLSPFVAVGDRSSVVTPVQSRGGIGNEESAHNEYKTYKSGSDMTRS